MNYLEDNEYMNVVDDILNNNEVLKLSNIKHHGITRLDHVIQVSYKAYKKAKKKNLDYKSVARAGLLHDLFFEDYKGLSIRKKIKVLINHPKYALDNSKRIFDLNELEEDIILSHMFPIGLKAPKYKESWLVNLVDDMTSFSDRAKWIRKVLFP